MPTELNNVSTSINSSIQDVYTVPNGRNAIILNIAISSIVTQGIVVFVYKKKGDNTLITLVPGKLIEPTYKDVYSPKLEKTILLSGEKLSVQASTESETLTTPIFGFPTMPDPLQVSPSEVAHVSISLAERN